MKIIVNADDFGWDDETVDATIACFEAGALTSATIMATMPAAERAAEYAKRNPRFSFGVHLTYVGDGIEPALTPGPELPTLARADGIFLPSQKTRLRALFRQVDAKQVERETIAQLDKIKSLGVPISHVDSHGHMHKFHAFRTTLAKVLPKYGITKVRSVQDVYLRKPYKSPTYWLGGHWKREVDSRFRTTQHLYLPWGSMEASWVDPFLDLKLDGIVEVGVHPGASEAWRKYELETTMELGRKARERGVPLVTWSDV